METWKEIGKSKRDLLTCNFIDGERKKERKIYV